MFDYYVDDKTGAMVPWATKVPAFVYDPSNFANLFVPTVETTRLTYLLNLLVANRHHVMLVGGTGALLPDFLERVQPCEDNQHHRILPQQLQQRFGLATCVSCHSRPVDAAMQALVRLQL